MNIFEYLNGLTLEKKEYQSKNDEFVKDYEPYSVNRWISMSEILLPYANLLNLHYNIPKQAHYQFFYVILPKIKIFFKYIKKNKDENRKEAISCIARYYEVGRKDAEDYFEMLTESQIKKIMEKFNYGKEKKSKNEKEEN